MPKKILSTWFASITRFIHLLFGKLSWNSPPWIKSLCTKAKADPQTFWGRACGLLILVIVIVYTTLWYQHRPQPQRIVAQVTAPKITPNDKTLVPDTLSIDFGLLKNGELANRSVAPLNLVGKDVNEGITLSPAMPGKWTWDSDSHLLFTPSQDWPAGQAYSVTFDKQFFTPGTQMASLNASFSTQPFVATIAEFKFYQDPINPQIRQAVATVNFNYPVDAKSLENSVSLHWQALKDGNSTLPAQDFKYTITYDAHKRAAYIRSEPMPLPKAERFLELTLSKGIRPETGPSETAQPLNVSVLVPDAASYFTVRNTATAIVRNQQDRPEQIVTLETSLGVSADELTKSLHVYLLPTDYPATAAEETKLNYQWKDPGEVTPAILALAKPVELQAIPADREFATLHSFKFNVTPGFLYVKLDKGTSSFGNYLLAKPYVAILPVPNYPQEIAFLHKGALLALGTDEKLSVLVRGLGAVKFNIARVLPEDINHLVTQTGGDYSNPFFVDPSFTQDNISEIYSQVQSFDVTDPGKAQYTALDLGQYLTAKNHGSSNLGLFLLQAHGWDAAKNTPLDVQTNRLVLITDLGLITKDNSDGTHDVYVQSITAGTPVNQAAVSILGKNGLALLTRATDAQGRASFPTLKDFINEREPTVYLVRKGNDVSFMPYNRPDRLLNYSRFDVGGVTSNDENPAALTAYLFSERGIYRPGDIVHVGMIVKQPFVLPQQAGLPLEATVVDARGTTVKDEKITLNDSGYLTLDFQTTDTSATGQYLVNLYIVKDNHASSLIGTLTFNVAEFLPDRMRITAHLSPAQETGWVSPTDLSAQVGLWNLYGAPAVNHRIGGKILLTPQAVSFKAYPDYIFVDPLLNPKSPPKVFTDTLADTRTNDKGEAELTLNLNRFEKATYQLTVFAEGFEADGGRSVTTQTTALVSPLAYLVGYKADGDLNYINQNGTRALHFIAINPQLKQQALSNLKLQLFAQHPVTTLIKKDDGTYQYQSIIQTSLISNTAFNITDKGADFTLPAQTIGDFLLTLVDQNGSELSRVKYSIVGSSQQPLPKNAELTVKLNKSEFAPGEDIEMQITAPYTGAGLITLERNKVYATQWFKTNTTASVQKIHIPADFQGDGYVNIAFVRDINSPEIFMSPLSYSVQPFSVTHKDHEIAVELSTPALSQPGLPFPITYKTDKPAKIIVFAVDEGILQVSKFTTPDPLAYFFQKHALEVNTMQIVDQILPKFMADRELSSVGGDDGEAALRKNLNPFKRRTEAPVVYWSGLVDADATPRQLIYNVPDYFNGSLRVMAVAVAANAVGAATNTAEIRGPFVINPNVPTFVAPGDEFEVTASIANNVQGSGPNAQISIRLTSTSLLENLDEEKQTLVIPEGQERSVHYKMRAKSLLGSADLKITASLGEKSSTISSTASVRPATPYYTSISSGYSTNATLTLSPDRRLYSDYRVSDAAVSPTPLILVSGLRHYLNEYPYGCTEQLVSKAFPLLTMTNLPWFTSDTKLITSKIQKTIQMLAQRQMSNGGFNYWPEVGSTEGNDFDSVYAMHFLTEAKAQGEAVPSDVFSAGIAFLKEFAARDITSLDQARIQAYAIYVLTRNEIVTTNYLTHLQLALDQHHDYDWHHDITSAYIAATYQLMKSSAEAEKMIAYYQPEYDKTQDVTDFYNQSIGDAQYLYLVAKHFPNRLLQLNINLTLSLANALNNDNLSTVLASYTSLALAAYSEFYPASLDASLSIAEVLDNGAQNELSSSKGQSPLNALYQKASLSDTAKQVIISNPSKRGFFYQLLQAGFDKDLNSRVINQGIEVYREYRNADDKVVSSAQLGDEIVVHVRARALDNQYHDNVALVDLLPGGFEVIRDSITLQNMDYADIREDRILFFGSVSPDSKELVYRIKATTLGKFTTPPMFAVSMYNPQIKSLGVADSMAVTNKE